MYYIQIKRIFNKRYKQALTPSHFISFLLTPKYHYIENKLEDEERDAAF